MLLSDGLSDSIRHISRILRQMLLVPFYRGKGGRRQVPDLPGVVAAVLEESWTGPGTWEVYTHAPSPDPPELISRTDATTPWEPCPSLRQPLPRQRK